MRPSQLSKAGVIIMGGGVIGCSIAYHLAEQGIASIIIERDAIASQASGKAWAVMSPPGVRELLSEGISVPTGHLRPLRGLFEEGFDRFPELAQELKERGGIDIEYRKLPCIRVTFQESEVNLFKKRMFELESEGFELSWLEGDEIRVRFPYINPEVKGGVLSPSSQVEPYRYTLGLFQAAEARGTSLKQTEAVGFRYQGSKVASVICTSGEIEADIFVLAMGPWSGQGASWLGEEMPIRVLREQCLAVEMAQRLAPYRVGDSEVMIIPSPSGRIVIGGGSWVRDRVDFDNNLTEEAKFRLVSGVVALVPKMQESVVVEHRAALEGWPPTGTHPMLGRLPRWDNVYVAVWLGTRGIALSPGVGRTIATLIVTGRIEKLIEPFSPKWLFEQW